MHIHQNIKYLRKAKGWTQGQLAEQLGKTYITVGDYERGKASPPLSVLLQLHELFSISLDELVFRDMMDEVQEAPKVYRPSLTELKEEVETLRRINRLQEQRLAELEREIREQSPDLAKRLGL